MYSKSGSGYVLVITSETHRAGTGRKGVNGHEIQVDIRWQPLRYAFNFAEVLQLPITMGSTPINQVGAGAPGYGPVRAEQFSIELEESPSPDLYAIGGVYKYKTTADIEPEVEVGDRIYFKARTLNNPLNFIGKLKAEDGKNKLIYKVPYENIFCAVRTNVQVDAVPDGPFMVGRMNTSVIPIGTWTIVEPIFEDWDSILKPTYYPYKDKFDMPIERPKSEWIQKKVAPEHDNMRGIIKYIGSPYKGDVCDMKAGDRIVFRPKACHFEVIEGEKLIVMRQEHILAKLEEDIKVQ